MTRSPTYLTKGSQSVWLFFFFQQSFLVQSLTVPFWTKRPGHGQTIICWMSNWLTGWAQRFAVNQVTGQWPAIGGLLWGSILGSVPCNISVNDLDAGVECTVSNFSDIKLGEVIDSFVGRETLQRDMDRLVSWAMNNSMKFYRSKYWILHLRWVQAWLCVQTGDERLENCPQKGIQGSWLMAS